MTLVKVAADKYINVDRMTYVSPSGTGALTIHFGIAGIDEAQAKLNEQETQNFIRWLDAQSQDASCEKRT